jgi:polyhydroxybutyrate depolymerase
MPAHLPRLLLLLSVGLASCGTAPRPATGGHGGEQEGGEPGGGTGTGGSPAGSGGQGGGPRADAATGGSAGEAVVPMRDAAADSAAAVAADAPAPGPVTASEACGKGLPVPMEGVHQLMVGAMNRKFFLRLPSGYDGKKAWPVVFAFHGAGNKSAAWFDTNTDLKAQLEEKAVLLFPEGPAKPDGSLSWVYLSPENVLFADAMVDWLKKTLCIDPSRLFATGQSSGGYMAMTLGCQRGTVFRAVGTSSGGILEPGTCTGNPHVLMRTGRGDSASTQESVVKTRDFWTMHKGCSAEPPKAIEPAPCVSYAGCGGATVVWCQDGGPHAWPGFATKAMWNLFSL